MKELFIPSLPSLFFLSQILSITNFHLTVFIFLQNGGQEEARAHRSSQRPRGEYPLGSTRSCRSGPKQNLSPFFFSPHFISINPSPFSSTFASFSLLSCSICASLIQNIYRRWKLWKRRNCCPKSKFHRKRKEKQRKWRHKRRSRHVTASPLSLLPLFFPTCTIFAGLLCIRRDYHPHASVCLVVYACLLQTTGTEK